MPKHHLAYPFAARCSLALAIAVTACSPPAPSQEPVRSVKVLTVAAGTLSTDAQFSGEVRAKVESRLGFRVPGKIVRRQAEVGQRVRAGQLLAELDPRDYQLAADAARAQVAAAQTNRDLAAADFKRFAALKEQNFISGAELERRDTALKAAQAQLEQAQAQLAAQGNQTQYTRLLADVPGVITAVEAEAGQVVSAGSVVVRIAQDGARDVVFSVPEDRVAAIKPGSPVTVRPWSQGDALPGKVREVGASADPVTRTYTVKVAIDSGRSPPLGATVYVSPQALSAVGKPVIKLPTSALRKDGQGSAVWLLDPASMTLKSQPVQVASIDGNDAVIAAGLQPGMVIVAAGVHVLAPGQKVALYQDRVKDQVSAPAAAGSAVGAQAATGPTGK